jgi:hypothetical protein
LYLNEWEIHLGVGGTENPVRVLELDRRVIESSLANEELCDIRSHECSFDRVPGTLGSVLGSPIPSDGLIPPAGEIRIAALVVHDVCGSLQLSQPLEDLECLFSVCGQLILTEHVVGPIQDHVRAGKGIVVARPSRRFGGATCCLESKPGPPLVQSDPRLIRVEPSRRALVIRRAIPIDNPLTESDVAFGIAIRPAHRPRPSAPEQEIRADDRVV